METPTCETCGPAVVAYMFVIVNDTELSFCGHHGAEYLPAWERAGYEFYDLRYTIA